MSAHDTTDDGCPRCDHPLVALVFEGRRAVVCERCGYADVPADHSPAARDVETWDDALERFVDDENETEE